LETARKLWTRNEIADVSIQSIATEANVALQTIYNVFGPLDVLVVKVLEFGFKKRDLEIERAEFDNGVDACVGALEITSRHVIAEAPLYRRLIRRTPAALAGGVSFDQARGGHQLNAIRRAMVEGLISTDCRPEVVAQSIAASYTGHLVAWALGAVQDQDLTAAGRFVGLSALAAVATPVHAPAILDSAAAALRQCGARE
jgi:AcrR family transcriptional regulator